MARPIPGEDACSQRWVDCRVSRAAGVDFADDDIEAIAEGWVAGGNAQGSRPGTCLRVEAGRV